MSVVSLYLRSFLSSTGQNCKIFKVVESILKLKNPFKSTVLTKSAMTVYE